jgi:hypothetical protein
MNFLVSGLFETRLGFDYGELNVIDNMDSEQIDGWLAALKSDDEVPSGPCNLQICTTLVGVVASTAVQVLCNKYAAGEWAPPRRLMFSLKNNLEVYSY